MIIFHQLQLSIQKSVNCKLSNLSWHKSQFPAHLLS